MSLLAIAILHFFASGDRIRYSDVMIDAATIMQRATESIRNFCDSTGIEIDESIDPNRTCLIGPELTPLMTTLGHLDAKRSTTDPAMASVLVHLLERAGVTAGDTIAVGSSASFPALLVATLAAAEAMHVHPIVIISLGASTYGATNPRFNLLDIYSLLLRDGVLATRPAAVSLGGDNDVGAGFDADLKADLLNQIAASGLRFISDPDLRRNVSLRMQIYAGSVAFINAGGGFANLGTSAHALQLEPGLSEDISLPPVDERGVLFEMAARQVPVIHLLFIRGLVPRYGISWDPIPLTEPGEVELRTDRSGAPAAVWLIGIPYFLAIAILVGAHARSARNLVQHTPHDLI